MRRLVVGLAILSIATLTPWAARADDQQTAQQIIEKLAEKKRQGQLRNFSLDLNVVDGVVYLDGRVSTLEHQRLIVETTRTSAGVKKVVNRLRMEGAAQSRAGTSDPQNGVGPPQTQQGVGPAKPSANPMTTAAPASTVSPQTESLSTGFSGVIKSVFTRKTPAPARKPKSSTIELEESGSSKPTATHKSTQNRIGPATNKTTAPKNDSSASGLKPKTKVPSIKGVKVAPASGLKTLSASPLPRKMDQPRAQPISLANQPTSPKARAKDVQLAQRIVAKLNVQKQAGMLKGVDMDLHVQNSTVWLVGRVMWPQQQNLVLDIARREQGVQQVVNDLAVVAPPKSQAKNRSGFLGRQHHPVQNAVHARSTGMPQSPLPFAPAAYHGNVAGGAGVTGPGPGFIPAHMPSGTAYSPVRYDHARMPAYAWPSYAAHPNYAGVTYPRQYSPAAWPYIGPFYPYPQVPLGWREVTLKWEDGWWQLDFKNGSR